MSGCECKPARSVSAVARNIKKLGAAIKKMSGGAKRRGGSEGATCDIELGNHPSRDPLRDPVALLS